MLAGRRGLAVVRCRLVAVFESVETWSRGERRGDDHARRRWDALSGEAAEMRWGGLQWAEGSSRRTAVQTSRRTCTVDSECVYVCDRVQASRVGGL